MKMATLKCAEGRPSVAELEQYHADGFLIQRDVITRSEVAELEIEAGRLFGRKDLIDSDNIRCRWQNNPATGECLFDCFDPVIDLSAACARIARDTRILN